MIKFIAKRLGFGFLVMLGAVVVVFLIFQVLPGDPVAMMSHNRSDVTTREAIRKDLGLDQPIFTQLGHYLNDLSPISGHGDSPENLEKYQYTKLFTYGEGKVMTFKKPYLRRSFQSGRRVNEILAEGVVGTMWLALAAMIFATFFGILMGVFASLRQGSALDNALVAGSVFGISAPSFVLGTIISLVFGGILGNCTGLNPSGSLFETTYPEGRHLELKNIILPALTLGLRPLAIIVQLTRSSMIEVLGQDYIRTARAKGLSRWTVIVKHALKNALNPVITAVSGWLATLLAGAIFVEMIFGWKGIGLVIINAVYSLDYPVVMGATLFVAFVFIMVNIVVDILYAAVDPRVRLR